MRLLRNGLGNPWNRQIVLACDANAHHTIRGSTNINTRCECLIEYLITNNLNVVSTGYAPTFRNAIREEILDLTITNDHIRNKINNWHVSAYVAFYDHMLIRFNIMTRPTSQVVRKSIPRHTRWPEYCEAVSARPPSYVLSVKKPHQGADTEARRRGPFCPLRNFWMRL